MRARLLAVVPVLAVSTLLSAQAPAPVPSPAASLPSAEPMPVRRVVLYKTGVGYFEHLATVRNNQTITIRFTSAQLNDVLKSLTAIDLGKGQVTGISYNSVAPIEQRLGALRLPVNQQTTMVELLTSLRGARLEVSGVSAPATGRLLSVEQRTESRGDQIVSVQFFSVLTDTGEMRSFELSPAVRVRLAERDLRQELGRYLDVLGSTREQDVRNMVISTTGTGQRQLFVSYISEVPIWKTSYRLVFPEKGQPLLQGWAIVDNTIGEDWRNVELSLVAGAPQSFIQQLSTPYYGRRPTVPLPPSVLLAPQTHAPTLKAGLATLTGTVRDQAGSAIPGAQIELLGASGAAGSAVSGPDGRYEVAAPAGEYLVRVSLAGFRTVESAGMVLAGGLTRNEDFRLQIGGVSEKVTVSNLAADSLARRGAAGGVLGGVVGGLPSAPPPPPAPAAMAAEAYELMRGSQSAAEGANLGELFEYRIKEPLTLEKNKSALVPIVNATVAAERVSLWNRPTGSGRPLRAMWLTNSTGLTLDGGSLTIVDGNAFAGEGLIEPLKPFEKRLVSYAADLGLLVNATTTPVPRRLFRVRAREGIIIQDSEERATTTYEVRSESATATTLVVEHRLRPGWKLADGQKPAESTPGAERFRVTVDPGKEQRLEVVEVRAGTSQIRVGDVTEALIVQLAASGVPAEELERELRPVLDKKAEVAAHERKVAELEAERARILEDQQRLRENMKALRGSAEERQLLQRYTRQLDAQENRLGELQNETAAAAARRAAANAELVRLIGSLSFDIRPQVGTPGRTAR
ncbi:MAG: carboxypeptidase regulatory-like domain-containing protein [Acidobacteriota bacterium]|nr:carboxypeptidase regulatory-like domain-containing protein [Acidobacteriota bacterium]MDQ3417698.1 carboxypeptidase regulatory-like domain-containing protein [Acidobacteriota bacterium]